MNSNLNQVVLSVVENPSIENIEVYRDFVAKTEYEYIVQNNLSEAFVTCSKCATVMITEWIKKYGSSSGCPVSYAETTNRPFMLEKNKYLKTGI